MKRILVRLFIALTLMAIPFILTSARAQQADEDPSPDRTQPKQQPPANDARPPAQNKPAEERNNDPETQDVLAFTGTIAKVQDEIVLKDPVTKMVYRFDDPSKVEPYVGKQVKVVGKLGLNSNTIHVNSVQVIPHDESRPLEELKLLSPMPRGDVTW